MRNRHLLDKLSVHEGRHLRLQGVRESLQEVIAAEVAVPRPYVVKISKHPVPHLLGHLVVSVGARLWGVDMAVRSSVVDVTTRRLAGAKQEQSYAL